MQNKELFLIRNIIKFIWSFIPGTYKADSFKNTIYKFLIAYEEKIKVKYHKTKTINVVYDCAVSPPTYGDFIYILMVSRYFKKKNYKTNLIIINGEYRKQTWQRVKKKLYENKVLELKKLAINFKSQDKIEVKNWKTFIFDYEDKKNVEEFFFKERVFSRKRIYSHSFNFLNLQLKSEKNSFQKKFLLVKEKFDSFLKCKLPKQYIAIHFRYSKKGRMNEFSKNISTSRNISYNLFKLSIEILSKKFPNLKLIIISERSAIKEFKKFLIKKSNLVYADSFSKNILGDAAIVLNSKLYFQVKGGGIYTFALFSNVNSIYIHNTPTNELTFNKKRYSSWQNTNHSYIIANSDNEIEKTLKNL